MNNTEKQLEFDKVKAVWKELALTEYAKNKIAEMRPILSENELSAAIRETSESKILMEKNGFKNLSDNSSEPEPAMALHNQDFIPYREDSNWITCQKISTKEDFISWIDVVNTALHGWNMIDAEHYFSWVKSDNIKIYSAKINGITVSTCATIQNGDTASLEFVSTLE